MLIKQTLISSILKKVNFDRFVTDVIWTYENSLQVEIKFLLKFVNIY